MPVEPVQFSEQRIAGINWSYQNTGTINNLWSVYFVNTLTGWAAGENGTILKTTNGGNVFIGKISSEIPPKYKLYQNYPNPFNPATKIRFDIASDVKRQSSNVKLVVYDILGKEIHTPVNEQLQPGGYEVTIDGSNMQSGIYFYQLIAGEFKETKKLILLK